MNLIGPYEYTVCVQNNGYVVLNDQGGSNFVRPVTVRCPKLYVFAARSVPIYIGQTIQGMAARIRLGFAADGSNSYHGYRWRHELESAQLFVWCVEGVAAADPVLALECIECEFVYAYRIKHDQWPQYQTEIHFHPTNVDHRSIAAQIFDFFPVAPVLTGARTEVLHNV